MSCFATLKRIQSRISLDKEEYAERSFITAIWLCEKFTSCKKKKERKENNSMKDDHKKKARNDKNKISNLLEITFLYNTRSINSETSMWHNKLILPSAMHGTDHNALYWTESPWDFLVAGIQRNQWVGCGKHPVWWGVACDSRRIDLPVTKH